MNHVCLVSDQPMPNFLPVLNPELRPDSVTLVVSERMRERAQWLRRALCDQQITVLDDIPIGAGTSDIASIQQVLLDWAVANPDLFAQSMLNATGGTKPMAIAAQEVFRAENRPVFYVDVATDMVSWLGPGHETIRLANQPTLNQFFHQNGLECRCGDFRSELPNEYWRHFYGEIAVNIRDYAADIGKVNLLAQMAELGNTLSVHAEDAQRPSCDMTSLLEGDELATFDRAGNLCFRSAEARRFCNGIWLEHLVFETLKSFGFDRRHALMNATIVDSKGNRNELDSIVLHGNTCFVIEDKTRNMRQGNVADNAVYKLAKLSQQMGLRARGVLVSAMPVRPADRDRAMAYGVSIADNLPTLAQDLRRFIGIQH